MDIEAAFRAHAADLLAYVARRVPAGSAEDVVAETFTIALQQARDYDEDRGSERAWLFGIATNLIRRHWRVRERSARGALRLAGTEVRWSDPIADVADQLDAERDVARLASALLALSEDERELILLVAWGGLSPTEAAAAVGIHAGTARSRLHRIRGRLRAELQPCAVATEETR